MRRLKKILCLILAMVMLIPNISLFNTAFAQTAGSEPLTIEVTTDKSSYKTNGIAEITVKITNTSDGAVNNVKAEAIFEQLTPVKKNSNETYKEVDSLQPDESITLKYKAILNADKVKVGFFDKIGLWFVKLFNGSYTATNHNIDANIEKKIDIKFGKYTVQNVVKIGYEKDNIIEFGYLHSQPSSCYVGNKENITFFVDIASNNKNEIFELELYMDNKLIGTLNDSGLNGDVSANDSIYSGTVSLFSNERKYSKYYVKFKNQESNKETFFFAQAWTDDEKNIIYDFYSDIDKIKEKYFITNEQYENSENEALSKIEQCYHDIIAYLESRTDINNYSLSTGTDSIVVMFDFAVTVGVPFGDLVVNDQFSTSSIRFLSVPYNEKSNDDLSSYKSEIITMQPYRNSSEFGNSIATDEAANNITKNYNNYYFFENLDDNEITVDTMKSLSKYGIIIIESHGGNWENVGYVLSLTETVTQEKNNNKYKDDIDKGRVIPNGNHYVITQEFFNHYYNSNDFDNSLIYLGTCHGGDDDVGIRNIFKQKGAEAVITYTNSVIIKYMHEMLPTVFKCLSNGKTIKEAVATAKIEHGSHDPYIDGDTYNDLDFWNKVWYNLGFLESSDPAELILTGNNTSFKLVKDQISRTIVGLVVESVGASNEPLANVTVTAENDDYKIIGETDANGEFSLKLPLGTYEISLSLDNYTSSPTTITVDENTSNQAPYLFFMKKENSDGGDTDSEKASVHGMVIDSETQENISNVNVTLYSEDTQATYTTVTDESGAFNFKDLTAGNYTLSFEHDDYVINGTHSFTLDEGLMFVFTEPFEFTKKSLSGGDDSGDTTDPNRTVTASGDCGASGDKVTWILYDDGELVISGSGEMHNYIGYETYNIPWYSYESYIKKIVVGDGVTSIGNYAFDNFDSLTSVTIGDSVTTIGNGAFRSCGSLTSVTIPNSVTSIGASAFSSCTGLTSVAIPDSVTTIGNSAFSSTGYYNDTNNWANNVLYINNHLIEAGTNISGDYEIKEGTVTIASYAFYECTSLESITIPNNVKSIDDGVFEGCTSLVSITISDSVISIGKCAFDSCDSLTSVTIPDSLISIGKDAFDSCNSLTSVTIGNSVTSIGEHTFYGCTSLKSVYISDISAWCNIDFGYGSNPLSNGADLYLNYEKVTDLIIPDSVTSIDDYAFYGCTSLRSVTIPDSVILIDDGAFCGCRSLTGITVDSNNEYYSSDEYGVLFNKDKTTLIQYPKGNTRTSYTIPDGVTSISNSAFYNCVNLTSITIPDSVTTIGDYVFYDGELLNAYYLGTEEQWNEIAIGSYNTQLDSSTIHYNC